jgi:hypothetical protein
MKKERPAVEQIVAVPRDGIRGLLTLASHPRCCAKKREGKAGSAGHGGPMGKLCNAASTFFRAQPEGRDRIRQAHRHSSLTEITLLRGSRLVPAEIYNRGAQNKCQQDLVH